MNLLSSALLFHCMLLYLVNGSNILFIIQLPAQSHFQCFYPLMEELVRRGHNVTAASCIKPPNENITHIDLSDMKHYFPASFAKFRSQTRLHNMLHMYTISHTFVNGAFNLQSLQQLASNNHTSFDVVLVETYYSDLFTAFAHKFNAPLIGLVPQILPACYNWLTSNPLELSYIPNMYLPFTDEMTFLQRVTNTVFGMASVIGYELKNYVDNQEVVDRHFPYIEHSRRNLKQTFNNISLILANTHYSIGYPKPVTPKIIEVAGIHLQKPKPLPKNIQKFMDEAENGVVYVSFGSLVDPTVVEEWSNEIISVFEKTPMKVLWKWKRNLVKRDIPENILLQEWFPQNDILHHQNCKLFVGHGGIHSIIEAVNAAVPMIGVPFFSDQTYNMALVTKYGLGISLGSLSKEQLEKAVHEILTQSKYREAMKVRSRLFKDRIVDPLTQATYWVEHVIRYKGTLHLNSGAAKLSWYQYILLDVITFFLLILFVVIVSMSLLLRLLITFVKKKYMRIAHFTRQRVGNWKKTQ